MKLNSTRSPIYIIYFESKIRLHTFPYFSRCRIVWKTIAFLAIFQCSKGSRRGENVALLRVGKGKESREMYAKSVADNSIGLIQFPSVNICRPSFGTHSLGRTLSRLDRYEIPQVFDNPGRMRPNQRFQAFSTLPRSLLARQFRSPMQLRFRDFRGTMSFLTERRANEFIIIDRHLRQYSFRRSNRIFSFPYQRDGGKNRFGRIWRVDSPFLSFFV